MKIQFSDCAAASVPCGAGIERRRLSLLPLSLCLLLGLSAPMLARAQMSDAVWEATLTVQDSSGTIGCGAGAVPGHACRHSIDDDDFTVDGTEYHVIRLTVGPASTARGHLLIVFDEAQNSALAALDFCVGNTGFNMGIAGASGSQWMFDTGLRWAENDKVSLSLQSSCPIPTPTSLRAIPDNRQLSLRWAAPPGETNGYDVQYTSATTGALTNDSTTTGSNPATAWVDASHSGTMTTHTISGLTNGRQYRVRVRAVRSGSGSNWASATGTPVLATIPIPQNFTVTPQAFNGGPALLIELAAPVGITFGENTGEHVARVQVRQASTAAWPARHTNNDLPTDAEVNGDGLTRHTQRRVIGLTQGITYDVRAHLVRQTTGVPLVLNASTNPMRATTWTVPSAPTSPAATAGDTRLDVSWSAPSNTGGTGARITGYRIRWRTAADGATAAGAWNDDDSGTDADGDGVTNNDGVPATSTSHAITTGLANDTTYDIEIRALNSINPGSAWASTTGTPTDATPIVSMAGVLVDPTTLSLNEREMGEYTVVLRAEPAATVTITVASSDSGAASVSASSLTFSSGNWSTGQTVTVTAVRDNDPTDERITIQHTVTSTDANYNSITADSVTVQVTDDRMVAGVQINPTSLNVSEGDTGEYTVVLAAEPEAQVVLAVASRNSDVATVSAASLTFTQGNWSTAQPVTVTAVQSDSFRPDGTASTTISHTITSTDTHYSALRPDPVQITVASDDLVGVRCLPVAGVCAGLTEAETPRNPADEANQAVLPELAQALGDVSAGVVARRIGLVVRSGAGGGDGSGTGIGVGSAGSDALTAAGVDTSAGMSKSGNALTAASVDTRATSNSLATILATLARQHAHTLEQGQSLTGLLNGSAFNLPLHSLFEYQEGWASTLTLWGSGSYRDLNSDRGLGWEGDITSAQLGLDAWVSDNWLLGIAGAWSEGDIDYRISTDSTGSATGNDTRERNYTLTLYTIHPYVAWTPSDRMQLWASGGYGQGEIDIETEDRRVQGDVDQWLVAGGGSLRLAQHNTGALHLKLQAEHAWTESDRSADLTALSVNGHTLRATLEASRHTTFATGSLTPSLELGVRHDGGDGDTGTGAILGGTLRWQTAQGLLAEASGEALLGRDDYEEWSVWGLVGWQTKNRRGWSFTLQPRYGRESTGTDIGQLWQHGGPRLSGLTSPAHSTLADTQASLGLRLDHTLGRWGSLLVPYSELRLGEHQRLRLGLQWRLGELWDLDLQAERNEPSDASNTSTDHSILLEGRIRH